MSMLKRLTAIFLAVMIIFGMNACSGSETSSSSSSGSDSGSTASYSDDADSSAINTESSLAVSESDGSSDSVSGETNPVNGQSTSASDNGTVSDSDGGNVSTTTVTTRTASTVKPSDSDPEFTKTLSAVNFTALSAAALEKYYNQYWTGSVSSGHIANNTSGMIWEAAMGIFAMESYYNATNDEETRTRLEAEWAYLQGHFSQLQLVGRMGETPNLAADDAGWDAMAYMSIYRITGDTNALLYARSCILNAFEYFKDGDLSNGMWYCSSTQYDGDQWKSIYVAAQVITVIEYSELTAGTDYYDASLYSEAMKLYTWLEENMCRDEVKTYENGLQDGSSYTVNTVDYLYWCDFNVNRSGRTEKNGPDGGTRATDITASGSVSSLFGNMAMAAINAKLYTLTGDDTYKTKALRTAASITSVYASADNTYINDRDHGTDSAFVYYYVKEVLTLDGITQQDINILANTGYVIATYGSTSDGYYHTSWRKKATSSGTEYNICAVMGTNVGMITGAAMLQKIGMLSY